jgi:hypothetical protein
LHGFRAFQRQSGERTRGCVRALIAAALVLVGCSAAKATPAQAPTPTPTSSVTLPGPGGTPVPINPRPPLSTATPTGPFTSHPDGSKCRPLSDGTTQCVVAELPVTG